MRAARRAVLDLHRRLRRRRSAGHDHRRARQRLRGRLDDVDELSDGVAAPGGARGRVRRLPAAHLDHRRRPRLLHLLRRRRRRRGERRRRRRRAQHVHRGDDAIGGLPAVEPRPSPIRVSSTGSSASSPRPEPSSIPPTTAAPAWTRWRASASTPPATSTRSGSTTLHQPAGAERVRARPQRSRRRVHVALRADRFAALLLLLRRVSGNDAGPGRRGPADRLGVRRRQHDLARLPGRRRRSSRPSAASSTPSCWWCRRPAPSRWSTYYGGTRSERGRALALNPSGKLIFAGQTFSPDMPLLRPAQPRTGGNRDTFVVELDPPYTAFTYATYLGGSNNDEGSGVAVDRVGRVFTAGAASYPSPGRAGSVRRLHLRHLQRPGRRRHRRRRPRRRVGDAVRHRPEHQRRRRGSGRRRLHQCPGAGQQHASDRLLHPLPGRRIDGRVLRRSHRAVQSRSRPRHRRAALPARRRRRDSSRSSRFRPAAAPPSTPKRSSASRTRRSRPSSRATSRWSSTAR